MREAKDTTLRYLKLLSCLPRHPDLIGTKSLQGKLEHDNPEYSVSLRTMQRDLERLSSIFPISCIERGRGKYWFWTEKDALTQIPDMGAPTALALRMAEEYLQAVLPPPTLGLLRPYFKHARAVLADTELGAWASKVRIIHRGPGLIPPEVPGEVHDAVCGALLGGKQISVTYRRRGSTTSSERLLHPAGLVTRAGIVYLVASVGDYSDLRHFALHRMIAAQVLAEKARPASGVHPRSARPRRRRIRLPAVGASDVAEAARQRCRRRTSLRVPAFGGPENHPRPGRQDTDRGDGRRHQGAAMVAAGVRRSCGDTIPRRTAVGIQGTRPLAARAVRVRRAERAGLS